MLPIRLTLFVLPAEHCNTWIRHARRAVVAAALLHDVGKIEAGLGYLWSGTCNRWQVKPVSSGENRRLLDHHEIGSRVVLADAGSTN